MNRREYNIAVKEYSGPLYGYALKFMRDNSSAQDVVQDVFEKLWIHRKSIEISKAKSWMFTTAHNSMINQINRSKRSIYMENGTLPEKLESNVNIFESNEVVQRAVAILPPVQRSIILMRDLEGYSYDEIGEILELSKSQVKVYLFRARKKIKKQLKGLVELV